MTVSEAGSSDETYVRTLGAVRAFLTDHARPGLPWVVGLLGDEGATPFGLVIDSAVSRTRGHVFFPMADGQARIFIDLADGALLLCLLLTTDFAERARGTSLSVTSLPGLAESERWFKPAIGPEAPGSYIAPKGEEFVAFSVSANGAIEWLATSVHPGPLCIHHVAQPAIEESKLAERVAPYFAAQRKSVEKH